MASKTATRPPIRTIPSDDCPVLHDGQTYYPHVGEWVQMVPVMSIGEFKQITVMSEMSVRLAAVKGEPDEAQQVNRLIDESYDQLCDALADRIADWNWTNLNGKPLPKPDGTPKPLQKLRAEELYWLLTAAQGETPRQEKKDSNGSPITSSATARPRSRR